MLGQSPPNGRATITCEYSQRGVEDVRATAYVDTEDGWKTVPIGDPDQQAATITTYGQGRVGGQEGVSRALIYMSNFRFANKSEMTDHALEVYEADIYIEALGDWDSDMRSKHHRYLRDGVGTISEHMTSSSI